jgi:glutamyl endopeptidase
VAKKRTDKNTSGSVPRGTRKPTREKKGADVVTVSHKPVRGGAGGALEAVEEAAVALGAEDLFVPSSLEAMPAAPSVAELEAAAVPAGVLSYGDTPAAQVARLRAAVTGPTAPAPEPGRFTFESVFGVDTRFRVDPSNYPHSAVCFLVAEFPVPGGGALGALGTGWIVGRRTVITAGHCVYAHGPEFKPGGTFANRVTVFPARDGTRRPHQLEATRQNLQTTEGWVKSKAPEADYAAIILTEDLPEEVGAFGFGPDLGPDVRDGPFRVAGYPGEFQKTSQAATQWEDAGTVRVEGPHLAYRIDTTPGQSGGPVFFINRSDDPAGRFAVACGVHNYGIPDPTGQRRIKFPESQPGDNTATYITGEVLANLIAWKKEGDG